MRYLTQNQHSKCTNLTLQLHKLYPETLDLVEN